MKTIFLLLPAVFLFFLTSCVKDQVDVTVRNYTAEQAAILQKSLNLPENLEDYTLQLPPHLGGAHVFIDNHKARLGRVLFYDKNLSSNGQISCASCHKAEKAFADNVAFSQGVATERTSRNSLGLGSFPSFSNHYDNSFNGSRLFWDERAGSVAEQSEQSLLNPVEMGVGHLSELVDKINQQEYYDVLFSKAFPQNSFMTKEQQILNAIEEFVNSIGCFNTKYDGELRAGKNDDVDFPGFSPEENLGKKLFNQHCESCHNLLSGFSEITTANNGLDLEYSDQGVGELTGRPEDMGIFKVPMLRNIELSGPYMHDGRFETLEEVVEHYSTGIKDHPNLHFNLKTVSLPRNLNFSQTEKQALVAFLKTLTDKESLMDVRFSDPFK